MQDFGLYIVMTNPVLDYQIFAEVCVAEEVPMLQLREKYLSDQELLRLAKKIKAITHNTKTKFIVNDRPDLAILSRADGLHIGQDDYPWQEIAKMLNPETLLGVSTHSPAQAMEVIDSVNRGGYLRKPDYMSFGPIYPTPVKAIPDPAVGIELLKQVMQIAPLPVVSIGGIFPCNLEAILSTGAKNVAMIRHFTLCIDKAELRDKIRNITSILKEKTK